MLRARLEIDDLEGLSISLGKQLLCKMRGTLEICAFVAIPNGLVLLFQGKGLQVVINGNEAKMDKTKGRKKEKVLEENQRCLI